jgi:hypothetical protein
MKRDAGTAATEYMSMLGIVLFVMVICFQVYVSFTTVEKVEDAARTGARVGSMRGAGAGQAAATAALPGWIENRRVSVRQVEGDRMECDVWVRVPVLTDAVPFDHTIQRRVDMPIGG